MKSPTAGFSEDDPNLLRSPSPSRTCTICAAPSNGYHFNAPSCSACAAFFRRTVTLNRNFVCAQTSNCRVNYAMRVICRACRYKRCLEMGMERQAVQPRRDCNVGRRKISYSQRPAPTPSGLSPNIQNISPGLIPNTQPFIFAPPFVQQDIKPIILEPSVAITQSPEAHYAASYSSSEGIPSPKVSSGWITPSQNSAESILEDILHHEQLLNERRRLLYLSHSSISNILASAETNDIPYSTEDLKELTFDGIRKDIRPQILVLYEWVRGWQHFNMLGACDRKSLLRRTILYHTILDPAYLSYRLGMPNRFVMFNGMYVGIPEDSTEGWRDEKDVISADLKKALYRPLLGRVVNEIAVPMQELKLSFTEFLILKSLVTFKSASVADVSIGPLREVIMQYMDGLFRALNHYYTTKGLCNEEIALRTGNLVLLMSNVFAVGLECLESHEKIRFFDLWELDDLLLKLLHRS